MSWLDDSDDDDDEFDEADIRVRPNPKANRPRTKRRPAHSDAEIARILGVDRGRYAVLVGEDTPRRARVRRHARPRAAQAADRHGRPRTRRRRHVGRRGHASAGSSASSRALRCCGAAPTTPTRSSGSSSRTPTRCSSSSPPPTPSPDPARRPLPRRGAGCRHPDPPRRDQDRPRRPDLLPRALRGARPRGVHERARRDAARADRRVARRPLHGLRRPLGRRQVDARQRARARRRSARPATSTS